MLKQTYNQKLSQKLLPKIILSQNILAIPSLALDTLIKKELELNPMLEEESEFEQEENENTEQLSKSENEDSENVESETLNETPENKTEDEFNWDEYFENESDESKSYDGNRTQDYDSNFISDDGNSLKDNLIFQLHLAPLSDKLIFIGEEIVWSLNDEGYLTDSPEDILKDIEAKKIGTAYEDETFDMDEFNKTLEYIQNNFDPKGIAAQNLQDCLCLQIKRSEFPNGMKEYCLDVIKNHLDDLRQKRFEKISREVNIELDKVKEIIDIIQKLDPKPGFTTQAPNENYIIPDIIVKKIDDKYEIFLNERYTPALRISKAYKTLYTDKKKSLDKDTKEYIVNNFNRAKWFIDAINSRKETLIKIMEAILKRQRDYFDNNEKGLKPLYEKEVAEDIKMDTSTVSRAVRGKYVQTDFGIYELRSFFTTPLSSNSGEDVSNTEAKKKLKEIIDNEDKKKPLTDEELTVLMNEAGLKIARRTVAKYREAINIRPAKLRREI